MCKTFGQTVKEIYGWKKVHEKNLNIISHQGNTDEKPNEILLHTYRNDKNEQVLTMPSVWKDVERLELVRM